MGDSLNRIGDYQVGVAASVRQAMEALDRGGIEICFVSCEEGQIIGCITDGDVRRGLLRGVSLADTVDSVMNRSIRAVAPEHSRAEVLDVMRACGIQQVPVLDSAQRLVGIHLMRDFIAREELPISAVIMAGGRGERLRPLTDVIPKPMVKVAGRPILERLVLHLVGTGVSRLFISLNYLGEMITSHFGDGSKFGCTIRYLEEAAPRGTAGALSMLPEFSEPVLVLNGDLVTQFDTRAFLEAHRHSNAAITVGVKWHRYRVPFGVVRVEEHRVMEIEEKPEWGWRVNAGIYLVSPGVLGTIPAVGDISMPEVIAKTIAAGGVVRSFEIAEDWIDVGRPEELLRARGES